MPRIKKIAATLTVVLALAAAAPASAQALSKLSPNGKAKSWTVVSDKAISLKLYTNQYAHADYYRKASNTTQRHLWNKSGINTTATSGTGSVVFKIRTCEWIKDNDDKCSGWAF
ncbi:hypothetical protein [Streptomyces sp. SID14515]|uniref:hypothetical protein n=1 Tax=Streptomyces sp. SID14515 TaxID=2706074 RepID=UPI0013C89235|nr:hypothetical protein [Streptomyces sp. SID14515]NEB38029.1 hypothetical protein [Streptomyces sp. SID14515]